MIEPSDNPRAAARRLPALLLALALLGAAGGGARAQGTASCPEPAPGWSEAEAWAWGEICEGRAADFAARHGDLDPREAAGWDARRRLGAGFLETILLEEPFRGALPAQELRIVGAWFPGEIDLAGRLVAHGLELEDSRFDARLDLHEAEVRGRLSFGRSVFAAQLEMADLHVGGHLVLDLAVYRTDVALQRAEIGGLLAAIGATFGGELNMDSLKVERHLFLRGGATFENRVVLRGAQVGGEASMAGSRFDGLLDMEGMTVADNLFMDAGARFAAVSLQRAEIGGIVGTAGSRFTGEVDMDSLKVERHLFLRDGATFEKRVVLRNASIGRELSLGGSEFQDHLAMEDLTVGGNLLMGRYYGSPARYATVDLQRAEVGGFVALSGAIFTGAVNMDSLQAGRHLFLRDGATFEKRVVLRNASIGRELSLGGSEFQDHLAMEDLTVGGNLLMGRYRGEPARYATVDLRRSKVGGYLELSGASFEGDIAMESLQVGSSLDAADTSFEGVVDLTFGRIGANLELSGAQLTALDLSGTRVAGELRLGSAESGPAEWAAGGRLTLVRTQVGGLQDVEQEDEDGASWPATINLAGFDFDLLGGGDDRNDMTARPAAWFVAWLARQDPYTPQPYHLVASYLREIGYGGKANDILYASRERERAEAWREGNYGIWLGLTLLKLTVGYGLGARYFFAAAWVGGFVLLGAAVLRVSGQGRANGLPYGLAFSLDHLLPIIQLRRYHYDEVRLGGWARYYFYLHKLTGYVLASFLLAGLAGLTQQ